MPLFWSTAVAALMVLAATWTPNDPGDSASPAEPPSDDPAAFLDRLAGEWSVATEATLGPGQEPFRSESREVARRVGAWLIAETTGTTPTGQPHTSVFTVGYDPSGERFIATWIDSMQTHMWSYTGTLDESGSTLTLDTEGPIMGDPTTRARYRGILEVIDPDRKAMRSMILGPDGQWFGFSRAEYRRVREAR